MPLSADEAIEVARRHGLGMSDAVALVSLATDATDADRIAARFAARPNDEFAEVAARLFGPAKEKQQLPDAPDPAGSGAVTRPHRQPRTGPAA